MSQYVADHASAVSDLREAGSPVTFSFPGDGTYLADIDFEQTAAVETVSGYAIRVKDEPRQSVPDTQQVLERVTLLFAPSTLGAEPRQDMLCTWGGHTYTVKTCSPVAPDGSSLLMRVKVTR